MSFDVDMAEFVALQEENAALEAELARTRGEKESLQRGLRWVAGMLTGDPEATEMEVYVALRAALKQPKDAPEQCPTCGSGSRTAQAAALMRCDDPWHTQTQEPTECDGFCPDGRYCPEHGDLLPEEKP